MRIFYIRLIGITHNIILFCFSLIFLTGPFTSVIKNIGDLMLNIMLFVMGLSLMFIFINSFVTGKHFDNKFRGKLLSDPYINDEIYTPDASGNVLINLRSTRAMLYSFCIVFPRWANRISSYKNWFGGYNFRKDAYFPDLLFSYLIVLCALLSLSLVFVTAIVKWLT